MTWDIEAAKKRCEEATPGPWWMQGRLYEDETGIAGGVYPDVIFEIDEEGGTTAIIQDGISESDADFIAHARTDLPAAIAEIEKLRSENNRLCYKINRMSHRLEHLRGVANGTQNRTRNWY